MKLVLLRALMLQNSKRVKLPNGNFTPESVGIESQTLTGLTVENPAESLNLIKDALGKNKSDKGEKRLI